MPSEGFAVKNNSCFYATFNIDQYMKNSIIIAAPETSVGAPFASLFTLCRTINGARIMGQI